MRVDERNRQGGDSTRRWRNQSIAAYLKVPYRSDQQLGQALSSRFKWLPVSKCVSLLGQQTGITHYRNAYRPATLQFVKRNSAAITLAFRRISATSTDVQSKVRSVATYIQSLGKISAAGRHVSPFNGLTPTLSCLDPQRRFPIMNERTRGLLRCIEMEPDADGMIALSKLIGPLYNVRDAFELDA